MRKIELAFIAGILLAGLGCDGSEKAAETIVNTSIADTVMVNGRFYTQNAAQPQAQAVAIKDGRLIAVGTQSDIESLQGEQTQVIDLSGKTVLPGFHDLHVHPIFAGLGEILCSIPQGADMRTFLRVVQTCSDNVASDGWVTGGQWDVPALGEIPTRQLLDGVVAGKPVFLRDTSGHSAWVNSRALEIAGVDANTVDPEGGIIERDAGGVPTGVLRETAVSLVAVHIPPHADETLDMALAWALDEMLANGITSFTEAAIGFNAGTRRDTETYTRLADRGNLKQRTRLCVTWNPDNPAVGELMKNRHDYQRENLDIDCIKIFLDGVPTDSHTAAMLEPYEGKVAGREDAASEKGLLLMDQDLLNEGVARFDAEGLTVKFHAAGDAAVRAGLDAIAYARTQNGESGLHHNVGHCTFVAPEDMRRANTINATFEVSPYLWSPSPINDSITQAVGNKRIRRVWPVRELLEAGALVVPGSDWAVVPSVNPWPAIEALATREAPGGSKNSFGKEQAIDLDSAIKMFTVNSAMQRGMEQSLGQVREGMLADLVVLDRDPYHIPVNQLHQVKVLKTIIGGEMVFQ